MLCPFHCLFFSPGSDLERDDLLIAASGPFIYSFDLISERLLSVWPPQQCEKLSFDTALGAVDQSSNCSANLKSTNRQTKRQKISSSGEEIVPENAEDEILTSQHTSISRSPVIKLTGTSNGRYIIAVTEDKYIRVLDLLLDGTLAQLSERQ